MQTAGTAQEATETNGTLPDKLPRERAAPLTSARDTDPAKHRLSRPRLVGHMVQSHRRKHVAKRCILLKGVIIFQMSVISASTY